MNYYLSKFERDKIFATMTPVQQAYLIDELKRGKRTAFANILARDKGDVITPKMTLEEVEASLGEWRLLDFIDAGPGYKQIKPPFKCQCGKVLRYQYVIEHQSTKEVRKFGIVHFEEHTGFPPRTIKEITHGFEKIDYELDEILTKYAQNWTLPLDLPDGFMLPDDIIKLIGLRLPLLDRQVAKLSVKIREYKLSLRSVRKSTSCLPKNKITKEKVTETSPKLKIDKNFVMMIEPYLKSKIFSAKDISRKMLAELGYNESMGKVHHDLYVNIIIYMDGLCAKGDYICLSKNNINARYKKIDQHIKYGGYYES